MVDENDPNSQRATLHRQRGNIKGAVTTLVKKLDNWEADIQNQDVYVLRESLEYVVKRFESFESIQEQLEALDDSEVEHRETFLESYISTVARAKKYLRESAADAEVVSVKSSTSTSVNSETQDKKSIPIKLPEIDLPKFDGKIENWAPFYDLFTSVIDKSDLSPAGKLTYLKLSLTGKAKDFIESYLTVDVNYELALERLKTKYDSPRRALRRHWAILREYPKISKDTPEALGAIVDVFSKHLRALENLGAPVDKWDITVIDLILTKIGYHTTWQWELTLKDNNMPSYTHLLNFLEKRSNAADFSSKQDSNSSSRSNPQSDAKNSKYSRNTQNVLVADSQQERCDGCKTNTAHLMYQCPRFRELSIYERKNLVKNSGLCFNCLRKNCPRSKNYREQCSSKNRCKNCGFSHHSSLCLAPISENQMKGNDVKKQSTDTTPASSTKSATDTSLVSVANVADAGDSTPTVLLGSALIQVQGGDDRFHTLRAIIDSAATSSFISFSAAKRIGLHYERILEPQPVGGIGGEKTSSGIKGYATCLIKPRNSELPVLPTETIVIKKIVSDLPCTRISDNIKSHFSHLDLADPNFNIVKEVDFLAGADIFPHVYQNGKIFGPPGFPTALNSIFGWILTGRIGKDPSPPSGDVALIVSPSTDALLRKFWEIEEIPQAPREHPDDVIAEKLFTELHYRMPDGRYVVPLLIREDAPPLGDSKHIALKRLRGTERRLESNSELKAQYSEFLSEYEKLGHMTPVAPQDFGQAAYYIPHHYVTRPDSQTTRLRVVFDASQKTTSGHSLNDIVYKGPALQNNIFDIIIRFRCHQKVFTCDISKMYRQILIRPEDRKYQHIFWPQNGKLNEYELNTVSYGVAPGSFLALRTTKQLQSDDGHKFPMAVPVLDEDIFVDDIATGKHDTPTLLELKRQTVGLLREGGCEVQKWGSNCPELLNEVPPEHRVTTFDLSDGNTHAKLLGIHWEAQSDSFFYQSNIVPHEISKRNILSHLSRLFDPIGLISPIVFKAKTIMQKLWLQGVDWDGPVPDDVKTEWVQFYERLTALNNLTVERCVVLPGAYAHCLVGFSDASSLGYCALLYLRSESTEGVKVSLIAAKSRVAPTKTISIPRLELCAAQLLAKLKEHVNCQLSRVIEIQQVTAYTDSQVVLAWLKTMPCQLKCFEANRTTYILDRIEPTNWKFIPSDQNPADVGSRGCFADQLENHPLWWTGPKFLVEPVNSWPTFTNRSKPQRILIALAPNVGFWEPLIAKFSNFSKLQRVTAWLFRYTHNVANSAENRSTAKTLSLTELNESLIRLVKIVQKKHFCDEMRILETTTDVPKRLKALQPFIDSKGVLRVGGRLQNADLPYASKHPILLPKHDHFVNLLIDFYHRKHLHAGPRLLQSLLARQFWILAARSIIRSRLSKCVTCFRARPVNTAPIMANLPAARVAPAKTFWNTQIDFGGPFMIREHRRRNPRLTKAYLSLFVCMATKAVHLEAVSELSTEALLAAIDRFVSRRGLCKSVLTDNATNFTGAQRFLKEIHNFLLSNQQTIEEQLSARNIEWRFIPPSGPHMGGLHEAGIKSAKYHLKRVVGEQTLTFEELTTVFTKIEAQLNSRPLCQLSTDAAEVDVLTAGHFLVGGPLAAVPEYDFVDVAGNRLSRWQMLQKLTQQFWKVWSRDYLHTLIQRNKWQQRQENIKVGAVVIIADADTGPTQWKKGIIEEVHPGRDNVVRVVTVRTAKGLLKRPAVKIYPLPEQ